MTFLVAIVALVGALCALNLILMLGVIKRLREHTDLLSNVGGKGGVRPSLGVGEEVGEFLTSTVEGKVLNRDSLTENTVVAFFSPNCKPCQEKLPKFVEYSRRLPSGRDQVIAAIISNDPSEAADFAAALSPVASVVIEGSEGVLSKAFKIMAYPTLLRVAPDGGKIVVTAESVELEYSSTIAA